MLQQEPWWQRNKLMVPVLLGIYAVVFLFCSYISPGTYGGGDSWMHFLFAKYAFKHPANLMDQWAKPLFTLLASPWAQFGFAGAKLFNILCALLTGYISFLIAKDHYPNYAWLSIVFVFGVPIYFICVFTGLTEILFALFLVTGIYLYQIHKEPWALILVSFMPFIRSEGFLIIPVFAFMALYYKQYLRVLLLATGTIVFTFIGYFYSHTWGWVFSTNPYLLAQNVYGKGPLLQFVRSNESIAGVAQVVLVIAAVLIFSWVYYKQLKAKSFGTDRLLNIRFILIFGSFAAYFVAHSIFWKLGIFGSLGLIRVMAGIGPCIGLTAFFAFMYVVNSSFVQTHWNKLKYVVWLYAIAVLVMPVKVNRYQLPYRLSDLEKVQMQACQWIKENQLSDHYFYYYDPFVSCLLDLDPFDSNKTFSIQYFNNSISFRANAIVIWDSQFCPQEGRVPKRWLDENQNFQLLHEERNNNVMSSKGDTLQIRIYKTLNDIELKNMN